MNLYGWVIEYGRDMDGNPMTIFMSAKRYDKAAVDQMAVRMHGHIVPLYWQKEDVDAPVAA
jgi:hypothetical protein